MWIFEFTDLARLRAWIAQPETNAGWLVRCEAFEADFNEASIALLKFHADGALQSSRRPRLEVDLIEGDPTTAVDPCRIRYP